MSMKKDVYIYVGHEPINGFGGLSPNAPAVGELVILSGKRKNDAAWLRRGVKLALQGYISKARIKDLIHPELISNL